MTIHTKLYAALVLAGLASAQAYAADPAPATTTTSSSSAITMTDRCAGGGTRTVTGSYNRTTGALDTTTTLTGCISRSRDRFDGTTATKGKLLAIAGGFEIDITATVNTTAVLADGSRVTRVCTTTKKGSFTTAKQTFDGTTTVTNCSVTGKVLEHEGLVEHLLRPATGGEDGGARETTQRTMPPRADEDSVREIEDEHENENEKKPSMPLPGGNAPTTPTGPH